MKRRLIFSFFALSSLAFGFGDIPGVLKKLESSESGKLTYECEVHTRLKNVKFQVSLQTSNAFMEAELDNGIHVKGYASETLDSKSGTTYYFLQGGSAPYFQQLTLLVREGGNWAEFRKTYGGDSFRCELQ